MKECKECGKKLGILNSYKHPTMGKKNFVCGGCYSTIDQSVTQWREFVLANSFNMNQTKVPNRPDWNTIIPNFNKIQELVTSAYPDKEIIFEK